MRALLLIPLLLAAMVGTYALRASSSDGTPSTNSRAEIDPDQWRALLQDLSDLAIADPKIRSKLTKEQIARRWLGEPPATNAQIAAAEKRLGVRLPPSYRAFLKVSNGWNHPDWVVERLGSADEIGWTRDKDPELVRDWLQGMEYARQLYGSGPPTPEDHLAATIMISDRRQTDGSFMLDPATRRGEEMEAWDFSAGNAGAHVYPSFWHLMVTTRDMNRMLLTM